MNKPKIKIEDIQPLKDSYPIPEGYFDVLADKINQKKEEDLPLIKLEDITPLVESYQVPEGYFDGLMDRIEERKEIENNVVSFRSRRIKILGSLVAAACIAMVVVSVINFGPEVKDDQQVDNYSLKNISDKEMASLLNERDDEFELTEEEIIEIITHETIKDESTAIIHYLQEEDGLENNSDDENFLAPDLNEEGEDFLGSI